MDRKNILEKIIKLDGDLKLLQQELHKYPWDWDVDNPLIVLKISDVQGIFNKILSGIVNIKTLDEWASIIECREDINYEHEEIEKIIFELANPVLYGKIQNNKIVKFKRMLYKL